MKLAAGIQIDGSHGEGAGALLRAALVISSITTQPVSIHSIRHKTRFPGLDPEDLTILKALTKMCAAQVEGAEQGSEVLHFHPTRAPKKLEGTITSERNEMGRGSNALVVLSTLLPVLARTGTYLDISAEGETYGRGTLSYDYFANVTLPVMRAMNVHAYSLIERSSFSRDDAGKVSLSVEPGQFSGLLWNDRGRPDIMRATVTTCRTDTAVAGRAISHLQRLAQSAKMQIDVERIEVEGSQSGVYITVWTPYTKGIGGGGAISSKGVRVETIAQQAFDQCFEWMTSDATLDPYVAEHMILPACFATSSTEVKISELTPRLLTSIWVMKQFAPTRIVVRGSEGTPGQISIQP